MNTFEKIRQSYVGTRYGKLVALQYISRAKGYRCVCDCGNEGIYKSYRLRNGISYKCSKCPRKNKGRPVLADQIAAKRAVMQRYIQSAKRRKIQWGLSEEETFWLIEQECRYCGLPPFTDMKIAAHPTFRYTGIDRVDNKEGYTVQNCVPCCTMCNQSKLNYSYKEWRDWLTRAAKHEELDL